MEIREASDVPGDEVIAFVLDRVPLLDAGIIRSTIDPAATEHLRLWEVRDADGRLAGFGVSCRPLSNPESWRFVYVVTRRVVGPRRRCDLRGLRRPALRRRGGRGRDGERQPDQPGGGGRSDRVAGGLARERGAAGQRIVAVLARLDGRPAAISFAVADGDEMHVRYTGVDRDLRGRALGRRTKEFCTAMPRAWPPAWRSRTTRTTAPGSGT
jgi:hypothetical protein